MPFFNHITPDISLFNIIENVNGEYKCIFKFILYSKS